MLPQDLRRSLTLDNGTENALHQQLAHELGMQVFFCHAYASYEKGGVENSNREFRKFFKKGLCLSLVDHALISKADWYRNSRPMKCLEFSTPQAEFNKILLELSH